jgi:hypothetical protein
METGSGVQPPHPPYPVGTAIFPHLSFIYSLGQEYVHHLIPPLPPPPPVNTGRVLQQAKTSLFQNFTQSDVEENLLLHLGVTGSELYF